MAAAVDSTVPFTHQRLSKTTRFSEPLYRESAPSHFRNTIIGTQSRSAPTPSKEARRFSARVEKPRDTDRNRPEAQIAHPNGVEVWIHKRREELHVVSSKRVTEIQGAVEARIDELAEHFEKQLKVLQEAEQPLHLPFANEMIRVHVLRKDPDGSEVVEYQEVALRERITNFQKLANEKHGVLEDLMDQWVDTQRELLQLSAEILGGEALKLDDKQLYPELLAALREGEEEHDKNDSQYQAIVSDMEPLAKQVNDLSAETKKSATKLDKQIRKTQKEKQIQALAAVKAAWE